MSPPFPYPLTAVVSVLFQFSMVRSGIAVGRAREKYQIPLPKTTGHPDFERAFRAHSNNAEQAPLFFTMCWLFAVISQNDFITAGLGLFWVIMRYLYVSEYHVGIVGLGRYTVPAYLVLQTYGIGIIGILLYQYFISMMSTTTE